MPFRALYEAILAHDDEGVAREVLAPWLAAHRDAAARLVEVGRPHASGWPEASAETLWDLYALSRVGELLLLPFQPAPAGAEEWSGPAVALDEVLGFMSALGLSEVAPAPFHPFFDEIVSVEAADDPDAPIVTTRRAWPALRLGSLLFQRAGCVVRAGTNVAPAAVATRSTLYWAHRRRHRPVEDLSRGWGSNSQWRTAFRRDYECGGRLCFNVDGHRDPYEARPERELLGDLTGDERVELLTHRCFVRTHKRHDDRWPYDDTYACAAPGA